MPELHRERHRGKGANDGQQRTYDVGAMHRQLIPSPTRDANAGEPRAEAWTAAQLIRSR